MANKAYCMQNARVVIINIHSGGKFVDSTKSVFISLLFYRPIFGHHQGSLPYATLAITDGFVCGPQICVSSGMFCKFLSKIYVFILYHGYDIS